MSKSKFTENDRYYNLLHKGERVFADGEIVVTHEIINRNPVLVFVVPHETPCNHQDGGPEARLDREHVERLRDVLDSWLKLTATK